MPLALDLFAGTGGATAAFRDRGWRVVTVDADPAHGTDVVADVATWSWSGERPAFAWFSPPCPEFSRWSMPWTRARNPPPPDMALVLASLRIVRETRPTYWVVENVRGAIPFFRAELGAPRASVGPFFLWGEFPAFERPRLHPQYKERLSSTQRVQRAHVPYAVSAALADAVERELRLFGRAS